jgi:hypothetical protein
MNGPQDASASQSAAPGDGLPLIPLGSRVRVNGSLPYLKTADPMPMLRPPDLIDPGETGEVVELRALGIRAVRFRRGTFLLEEGRLSPATPEPPGHR